MNLDEKKEAAALELHRQRHILLHRMADELVADYLRHNPDKVPSKATVLELLEWSSFQTANPTKAEP